MSDCRNCNDLREDNARMLEVVRLQGEFIQKIKHDIRDFLTGGEPTVMQRSIADQGLRPVKPPRPTDSGKKSAPPGSSSRVSS